jgi:4-amino-4-deoxy-L-arabinose transferase-like glycosyltransferase
VTPRLNGVKYFEKPPLQYWATAAAYSVFGESAWTSRLWAALLGFLCLPLVFAFATKIGYSRDLAIIATSILAINPFFVIVGQVNLLDQAFSFLLVAAVFAFVMAQRNVAAPSALRCWMLATWGCLALAVLSKGIVAVVLPGIALVIYMLLTRSLQPLRRLYLRAGLPLFALIVAPWFLLVQQRNPEFARFFFVHEHFTRFLTTVHERTEPWWYFLGMVLIATTPVIASTGRCRLALRDVGTPAGEFQVENFLLIWCAVVLGFFSLSGSKLAPYVLPLMPPLALIFARGVSADPKALRRAAWVLASTLCVFAAGLMAYAWRRNGTIEWNAAGWAIAAVAGACAACGFALRRRAALPGRPRWLALAAASIFGYQALIVAYAALPPVRSARKLALEVMPLLDARQTIYSVGQYRHSMSFYLGRTMQVFGFRGELEFGLTQAGITATANDIAEFRRRWEAERSALAFIEPGLFERLSAAGLPGRVMTRDARTIVVSR